jgi:ribosome maturation factor RimP
LPHPLAPDLEALACEQALPAGLVIRGLQVLTHRLPLTVQVLVQRADGGDVTLDACAAFSGPLGEAIEASGLLEQHDWVLEVSSPGIGELLLSDRDFTSFRGFPVEVVSLRQEGGEERREGLLLGRDEQAVQLNVRGRRLVIPRERVLRVRLTSPPDSG